VFVESHGILSGIDNVPYFINEERCFLLSLLGRQEKVEHYRDGRLINTLSDEKDFNYKRAIETV
jgi:hypothetical protein